MRIHIYELGLFSFYHPLPFSRLSLSLLLFLTPSFFLLPIFCSEWMESESHIKLGRIRFCIQNHLYVHQGTYLDVYSESRRISVHSSVKLQTKFNDVKNSCYKKLIERR